MDPHSFEDFREKREQDWKELGELLDEFEKRRGKPRSAASAERLGELYRRTAAHLSIIRTRPSERRIEASINRLLVRAHSQIYRPESSDLKQRARSWLVSGFPATVRAHGPEILISSVTFFAGLALGWGAVALDPDAYYAVVPLEEARSPGASIESLQESLLSGREGGTGERAVFSGFLWQHNSRVALLSFVLGPIAGIPTVLLILFNGLMLGAMSKVFYDAGLTSSWFAWIAGHGVTEIGALILAAAAGLALGRAVITPGPLTRSRALAKAGHDALGLVLGTVIMLFFAALLEGFFRQTSASTTLRFIVGGGTGALWLAYFFFAPRPQSEPDSLRRM
jgi:uncharacterized membrane protein SpoIIM required for sporulation